MALIIVITLQVYFQLFQDYFFILLIAIVFYSSMLPYDHNMLDKDYLFVKMQIKNYVAVFIKSFFQIMNHSVLHDELSFMLILKLKRDYF
jgi:hypothetical protein